MQAFPPVNNLSAHGYWLHKRIRKGGGRIILGAKVVRIEENQVIYFQDNIEKVEKAAMVITAMGARSENQLEGELKKLNVDYQIIGDARQPRRILEAIHEGYQLGEDL
jgi:flavin-dependent dehydrogenase